MEYILSIKLLADKRWENIQIWVKRKRSNNYKFKLLPLFAILNCFPGYLRTIHTHFIYEILDPGAIKQLELFFFVGFTTCDKRTCVNCSIVSTARQKFLNFIAFLPFRLEFQNPKIVNCNFYYCRRLSWYFSTSVVARTKIFGNPSTVLMMCCMHHASDITPPTNFSSSSLKLNSIHIAATCPVCMSQQRKM